MVAAHLDGAQELVDWEDAGTAHHCIDRTLQLFNCGACGAPVGSCCARQTAWLGSLLPKTCVLTSVATLQL